MKAVVLFFLGAVIFAARSDTIKSKTDLSVRKAAQRFSFNFLLEMLKKVIKEGYPDAGVPVLDPYQFENLCVDFEDDIFRIISNITDGKLTGLADFRMRKFNFTVEESMYDIEFDVFLPSLNFRSEFYEMEGSVKDVFPLAGEGVAHIEIYDVNIWSKIYLMLNEDEGSILVDRFEDAGFSISRIVSKTEYDGNIDGIANAMIEDLLANYLNRFNKYLAFTYSPLIVDAINTILLSYI